MLKHSFSDFSYAVNNDSSKKNNKEILVCFMYNGTEVLKKVYIPEKAGTAYIFEAKKIIDQEMRNGDLAAYAHKFVSKHKKKEASSTSKSSKTVASTKNDAPKTSKPSNPNKKNKVLLILLIVVSLLFIGALVLAIIFMLKKPEPSKPVVHDDVDITFTPGDGRWANGDNPTEPRKFTVTYDSTFKDFFNEDKQEQLAVETTDISKQFAYFSTADGEEVKGYYTFTTNETFTAVLENRIETMVDVSVSPGICSFNPAPEGEEHNTKIIPVDSTLSKTWKKDIEPACQVNLPKGYKELKWQYYDSGSWKDVEEDIVITKAMSFRATCTPETDIAFKIDPRGGTWKEGQEGTGPKKFEHIVYGTTWGEFSADKDLDIIPPSADQVFTNFVIGEEPNTEIVTSSYIIDGTDMHAEYAPISQAKQIKLIAGAEGSIAGKDSVTIYVPYGKTWGSVKEAFTPIMYEDYKYLKEFDYFTWKDGGDDKEFKDDEVISVNSPDELTAHYKDLIGGDFVNDSWGVIKREADKGLASFTQKYGNDFTSKTREVELFGVTYDVKVIGTDADTVSNNKTATLTFEFQEVVTEGISYINYGATDAEYTSSNIQSYLNDVLYNSLPNDLRSVINATNKLTYSYSSGSVTSTADKLFPLSLSEMGYTADPQGTTVKVEGSKYDTYSGESGTYIKNNSDGSPAAYWTRSPAPDHEFAAWGIDSDGKLGHEGSLLTREAFEMTYGLGVAPAFTVGVEP